MSPDAVARLRRAAIALRTGKRVAPDDAQRLAGAIEVALEGTVALDIAFGLVSPSPFSAEALAVRTALIQRLSAHYRGTPSGIAKVIAVHAARYSTASWPRLARLTSPPSHHRHKPEAMFFELHRNAATGGAVWPLAWRSILQSLQPTVIAAANISDAESKVNGLEEVDD